MEDKIKNFIKNKNNRIFSLILILGIVLMLTSGGDGKEKKISEEKRLEKILNSVENIEDAAVYITYTVEKDYRGNEKKPSAAVISVKNAEDTYVKKTVTEAAAAALDIPVHKVTVLRKRWRNTVFLSIKMIWNGGKKNDGFKEKRDYCQQCYTSYLSAILLA